MNIKIYAINLDRSAERWSVLLQQAEEMGFDLVRVSAVDGSMIPAEERVDSDEHSFERNNGRTMLAGEYGCYRSHLKALSTFLGTRDHLGVIIEDDIRLPPDLVTQVQAAFQVLPEADAIKLLNHRVVWFRKFATSTVQMDIGRAAHGPQGSTACYAVSRSGAEKLIKALTQMEYPWDVAFERGWATGMQIYTTRENVASLAGNKTTIATRKMYRASKFPWWRRLQAYQIRLIDAGRRIRYAFGR